MVSPEREVGGGFTPAGRIVNREQFVQWTHLDGEVVLCRDLGESWWFLAGGQSTSIVKTRAMVTLG